MLVSGLVGVAGPLDQPIRVETTTARRTARVPVVRCLWVVEAARLGRRQPTNQIRTGWHDRERGAKTHPAVPIKLRPKSCARGAA